MSLMISVIKCQNLTLPPRLLIPATLPTAVSENLQSFPTDVENSALVLNSGIAIENFD